VGGACSTHIMFRNAYNILVGIPPGKILLGRCRRICKYNIKTDLKNSVCGDVHWIHLAQDGVRWPVLMKRTIY
jgi:ribosomal protein S1